MLVASEPIAGEPLADAERLGEHQAALGIGRGARRRRSGRRGLGLVRHRTIRRRGMHEARKAGFELRPQPFGQHGGHLRLECVEQPVARILGWLVEQIAAVGGGAHGAPSTMWRGGGVRDGTRPPNFSIAEARRRSPIAR